MTAPSSDANVKLDLKNALSDELQGLDATDDVDVARALGTACMLLGGGANKQQMPSKFPTQMQQVVLATQSEQPEVRVRHCCKKQFALQHTWHTVLFAGHEREMHGV